MTYDANWPTEPNPDRADRIRYYAEQRRLRRLEQKEPLTDFDKTAIREGARRVCAPILSIDREVK